MHNNFYWVEKYRPKNLDEITSQNTVIQSLKKVLLDKNLPHLIFFGPSGCGKTSTIIALAKELFGPEYYSDRVIELNASDERGINVVREKIKLYARQSIRHNDSLPPWKIIILDEADSMTTDSQFALRRIMEQYSKITRFCIICNYHNKIIDPIISRCSLFRFKPIDETLIFNKLNNICKTENFTCSPSIINKIIKFSNGDLRKAINFLQRSYNSYGTKFNEELLDEVSGIIPNALFMNLIDNINNKNVQEVNRLIKQLTNKGYSLVNQISLFRDYVIKSDYSDEKKANIISIITKIDFNLIKGCDEFILFMRLAYFMMTDNNNAEITVI